MSGMCANNRQRHPAIGVSFMFAFPLANGPPAMVKWTMLVKEERRKRGVKTRIRGIRNKKTRQGSPVGNMPSPC